VENEKTEGNPNAIARAAWKALHFQANGNEKQGTIVETYCLMRDIAAEDAPFGAGIQLGERGKPSRNSVDGAIRYRRCATDWRHYNRRLVLMRGPVVSVRERLAYQQFLNLI
jgi:hypothetical protein